MVPGEENVVAEFDDRVPVRRDRLVVPVDPTDRDLVDERQGVEFLPGVPLVADNHFEQAGLGIAQQFDDRWTLNHRPQDTGLDIEGVEDLDALGDQLVDPLVVNVRVLLTGDHPTDTPLLS